MSSRHCRHRSQCSTQRSRSTPKPGNSTGHSEPVLDADLKILAEKKTAYARLLQQQQTLQRERDTDIAQAKNLEASLALIADEEAEYHRIEKTAGSYAEVRQRLDRLQEKKAGHLRLTAELGFATREIADLAARVGKQRALIKGLDSEGEKKAGLIAKVRAGLGAGPEIADDRLDGAVSFRLAEINQRTGTLAAQQVRYTEEREKILADRKTIQAAGADGTCPLCPAETWRAFREPRCRVRGKTRGTRRQGRRRLRTAGAAGQGKGPHRFPETSPRPGPHPHRETPAEAGVRRGTGRARGTARETDSGTGGNHRIHREALLQRRDMPGL